MIFTKEWNNSAKNLIGERKRPMSGVIAKWQNGVVSRSKNSGSVN